MRRAILALSLSLLACRGVSSDGTTTTDSAADARTATTDAATGDASRDAAIPTLHAGVSTSDFDGDNTGASPSQFTSARAGGNREGRWLVHAEADAPSRPNVVAQTDTDPSDDRFAMLLSDAAPLADVSLTVKCKPVSGTVDRACGLVCRLGDAKNYYLARANALENDVRLYVVEDGKRRQLGAWSGTVASGRWQTLGLSCQKDVLTVRWNGAKVITQKDKTRAAAGKVGLWTKSDSITYFDDLILSTEL